MNKQKKTAHTDGIGGRETFRLDIKRVNQNVFLVNPL